jgi:prolyl oligopeptidase PreP (S9A serine peptidase family)
VTDARSATEECVVWKRRAGHWNLDWFVPSPDARRIACGLSQGGSEQSTLRVLEAGTGELLSDAVTGAFLGAVSWLPSGDALLYHRYLDSEPGGPGPPGLPAPARHAGR